MPTSGRSYLTQQTLVPLGLIVGVFFTAVAGTWHLAQILAALNSESALRFQRLEIKLEGLEQAVTLSNTDRWNRADMLGFVEALKARNPNLVVPELR